MKKKIMSLLLVGAMVATMTACGGSQEAAAPVAPAESSSEEAPAAAPAAEPAAEPAASGDLKIGFSWGAIDSQMWAEYQKVAKQVCADMGVEYSEAVADNDTLKQNQQIETMITDGCAAIVIAPIDGEAVVAAIKKCNEEGVPVVMANRAAGEGAEVAATINSDNVAMVEREMTYVLEKAKAEGKTYKVIELIGSLTDVNALKRDEGFKNVASKNTDVFNVVAEVPTEWKGELAKAGVLSAYQEHDDINMIFSPSDALLGSVIAALTELDKLYKVDDPKHVTYITFDGAADAVAQIKEGYVDIVSVQDATTQSRLCVEAAVAAAKGEAIGSTVDPGFEVTTENVEELGFEGY